jgi:hypothetical protein
MEIISRKEAKTLGLTRYFTGKPCKHGHVVERAVSAGNCTKCAKQTNKNWKNNNLEAKNIIHKKAADKYRQNNKEKITEASVEYYIKNKKKINAANKTYRENNSEKMKERNRKYYHDNIEKEHIRSKTYRENNKGKGVARNAKRRAAKRLAVPKWHEESQIKLLYIKRDELSKLWNIQLHVDHIVPLQGENVCGLHCWDNLQLLEATLNISKSNNHI